MHQGTRMRYTKELILACCFRIKLKNCTPSIRNITRIEIKMYHLVKWTNSFDSTNLQHPRELIDQFSIDGKNFIVYGRVSGNGLNLSRWTNFSIRILRYRLYLNFYFRLIGSFFIFNKGENNFAENLGESVESNKINEEQKAVDR